MLRIAGQTAGLIGLKFFVNTHRLKNRNFFFKICIPRATQGPSASGNYNEYKYTCLINRFDTEFRSTPFHFILSITVRILADLVNV